jgi:hypothetical protein
VTSKKDLTYKITKSGLFLFSIVGKDITKMADITPALRKVAPPIELYKNSPKDSPMILTERQKLPATPCTAP